MSSGSFLCSDFEMIWIVWMKGHRWFRVRTINIELQELKKSIERKLQYSYVEQFVRKPFIDEDKLEILYYIYQNVQLSKTVKDQQILTVMLVQIALDTHDLIPNQQQDTTMSETEKQLTVLSGDYYSGLYYFLLAEIGEVHLIQKLAAAIRKMNENKMSLFHEEYHSITELLELIRLIEAELFTEVAEHLNHDPILIEIIQDMLLINRMKKEYHAKHGIITLYFRQCMKVETQEKLEYEINKIITHQKSLLENKFEHLSYQETALKNAIINKYSLSYNTSFAEEG